MKEWIIVSVYFIIVGRIRRRPGKMKYDTGPIRNTDVYQKSQKYAAEKYIKEVLGRQKIS